MFRSPGNLNWLCPVNWDEPLNRGLVARYIALPNQPGWGSSQWLDLTEPLYGNHSTLTNGPTWEEYSPPGGWGSVQFVGASSQYASATVAAGSLPQLTFGGWFIAATATEVFCSVNDNTSGFSQYSLETSAGGIVLNARNGGSFQAATASGIYTAGNWVFAVAVVRSATDREVWAWSNGLFASGTNVNSIAAVNINTFDFSRRGDSTPQYFSSTAGEGFLFNRALTASEAFALYAESLGGYPNTLNWIRRPTVSLAAGGTILPHMMHLVG